MRAQVKVLIACFALLGCSAQDNSARTELLAHTWAPSLAACGSDFLRFTPTAFEVHNSGGNTALQVLEYTTVGRFPKAVMVVVGPHEPGSSEAVPESEKIGFVLELSRGRMKLVGGGAPAHLQTATVDNPNVQRFDRVACS